MKKFTFILICYLNALACSAANPYLPLWEHIPDGEPYLFDDPDNPGRQRVYIYGSHDMLRDQYCGTDLVVWSADPDSLNRWRFDGVVFQSVIDGKPDVLYAPDVAVTSDSTGQKRYYLYPNNQSSGRNSQVAVASRPDGPFTVINADASSSFRCNGILGFDPAVMVDDDGRVYGYWGFGTSHGAELDPRTMATVKSGCGVVENMIPGFQSGDSVFRFFEASSIRKIDDKYVLIYSRMTNPGEFGLPQSNYTLAYCYSDAPLGPWTFGGTIIDCRGRDTDSSGNTIFTATPNGNTHGSILKVGDQWWVFYHRQSGTDEYSRQAMVSPISVTVEPGPGGRVNISEAEYTSEGFEINGLNPFQRHPAAIASHFTGPDGARQQYPRLYYSGPHFMPVYFDSHNFTDPYSPDISMNPVVNNTAGSILGYKYFNFDHFASADSLTLQLELIPAGFDASISVYVQAPWKGSPDKFGEITIKSTDPIKPLKYQADVTALKSLSGKQPLYLAFSSDTKGISLATLTHLQIIPTKK